tara:strand:- start:959 stop:1108 length:150 start_codon:yes stop_codon:yes gene_type:complete
MQSDFSGETAGEEFFSSTLIEEALSVYATASQPKIATPTMLMVFILTVQ